MPNQLRIAIIGSDIAGISAAYLLSNQKDHDILEYKVTLFEASGRLGGHRNSVDVPPLSQSNDEDDIENNELGRAERGMEARSLKQKQSLKPIPPKSGTCQSAKFGSVTVDIDSIQCNSITTPNLQAMMKDLKVELVESDMSVSFCYNFGDFEWAGKNLFTLFCQWTNIFSFSMYRMIFDILRFNRQAADLADESDRFDVDKNGNIDHNLSKMTLGEFFENSGYSTFFYENCILPMAAIWLSPIDIAFVSFSPILPFLRFIRNNGLLQFGNRHVWKTVVNGNQSYITPALKKVDQVFLNTKITSIKRSDNENDPVVLIDQNGVEREFDHVLVATNADDALAILGEDATDLERDVLSSIKYSKNTAYLHRDFTLMPSRQKVWSSRNIITLAKEKSRDTVTSLTYWMNNLQPALDSKVHGDVFVTLNSPFEPLLQHSLAQIEYHQSVYTSENIKAHERLSLIQNKKRIAFVGAWKNYGTHENRCTTGLLAAISLLAKPVFEIALNGDYPTNLESISPPDYLSTLAKDYQPRKPTHFSRSKRLKQRSFFQNNALLIYTGLFALLFGIFYNSFSKSKKRIKIDYGYQRGNKGTPNRVW